MAAIHTSRFRVLPAILLIATTTLATGCFDKESTPKVVQEPEPGYLAPTSPDNVIHNLEKSWITCNYNEYAAALSSDFTYVFAPQDVGGPDNNPATWGRTDDLLSASHLFGKTAANRDGYIAQSVNLEFTAGADSSNNMNGWTKVVLSQIFLTVIARQQNTGDPLDYLIQGDQANLWLTQEGGAWKIVRWEDKPVGTLRVQRSTWGQVKGLFL
jgi:hypothetical protein